MSKIRRYDSKEGDTIEDLLLHQEMLIAFCNMFLGIVKRAANNSCCICCDSCLSCDALELLREMGEDK